MMTRANRWTLLLLIAFVAIGLSLAGGIVLRPQGNETVSGKMADSLPGANEATGQPLGSERPPGFRDVAEESGIDFRMSFLPNEQGLKFKINLYDHGCGVAVGDYDGDGDDDVYFTNQLGPNALYQNQGDGTFRNTSKSAGVALSDRICVGATFGDYDNDGRQDLYVTSTRGGNVLFKNLGNGQFKDVTDQAGLSLIAHSQTAAFFDFDNDAYLDLFVTNTAMWTTNEFDKYQRYYPGLATIWELANCPKEYNRLYRNNRDGTFSDVTEIAELQGQGWGGDVAVVDYNDDRHIDLLVTNMFGLSQLYRNEGNGKFSDVTFETLQQTSWGAIGSKSFDFNNDGLLDLFIGDMHSDMWVPFDYDAELIEEQRKYPTATGPTDDSETIRQFADQFRIRLTDVVFGNTFFKNLGNGSYQELSDQANLETFWPWGVSTGDFDNDGYEDIFVPSGMGYPYFYSRNYLLMNASDGTFTDRSRVEGIEPPVRGRFLEQKIGDQPAARSSRCSATADFDGDGRLDIVVNNFNDAPYYFKNCFPAKNYVAFRLKGTRSNADAIGAVVTIFIGQEVMVRQVHAAGGYLSQSSKSVHFGLGDRPAIDRVEIRWPRGQRQSIEAPAINKLHEVIEPE